MICKRIFHNKFTPYILSIVLISIDLLSKKLQKNYTKNTGIAFSLLNNNVKVLSIIVGGLCIIILLFWLLQIKNSLWSYAFSLLFAGAFSNEIDRLFNGFVIDFINYRNLFVGNVADIYVCISAGAIFILLVKNIKIR